MSSKRFNIISFILFLILSIHSFLSYPNQVFVQIILVIFCILYLTWSTWIRFNEKPVRFKKESKPTAIEVTSLIHHIPLPLCVVDNHQQFVYVSNSFKRLLIKPAETVDQLDVEMRNIIDSAIASDKKELLEVPYHFRFYNVSVKRIDHDNHLLTFSDVSSKVTEQRSNRRLLSDISHELKTPITAIKGIAEVLIDNNEQDPIIIHDFLKQIKIESERLNQLVQEFLLLSKLTSSQQYLQITTFNLADLLSEVHSTFEKAASNKGLKLVFEDKKLFINADYEKLKTIFNNLVSNAIRYSDQGTINVKCQLQASLVLITISDQGEGIDQHHLDAIFDRFYRVDSARSSKVAGSGLGLSITKELVLLHKGTIEVQSLKGRGTTFKITLPQN